MERGHGSHFASSATNPHECWEVYQKVIEETKTLDDYLDEECSPRSYDDGEEEAEWLRAAGLGQLTEAWKAGLEVQPEELGAALRPLSRAQAKVVERRVRSLNHTVKQRFNQRQRARKPDIRNVFKDAEVSSTGTRSRSATPDSLDSISGETPESASPPSPPSVTVIDSQHHSESDSSVPSFVSIFHRNINDGKDAVRRIPSAPLGHQHHSAFQEIFRRSGYWSQRGDVACDSEGIQLTAYQRLGTIVARPIIHSRADLLPSEDIKIDPDAQEIGSKESTLRRKSGSHASVSRSHSNIYGLSRPSDDNIITRPLNRTSSHGPLSFEEMCRASDTNSQVWTTNDVLELNHDISDQEIELLSQRDLTRLQHLLWLELTADFDKYNLRLVRRNPNKRWKKAGNLFGVSLSTLLLRDNQLSSEERNIPLVFQKTLDELTTRGVEKVGILRVGGHKQKVETLCSELENDFYCKPQEINELFKRTPCHDLSAVLKKLLRDLPQPLLTVELIDAFYQTHGITDPTDLAHALNLLVLRLPVEHRCTLKALLTFLKLVVDKQNINKMSSHNVAMIMAPSLFPPQYIHLRDSTDLTAQVHMAAVCCQVTEALLNNINRLWHVPRELIEQLRLQTEEERYRRFKKKY